MAKSPKNCSDLTAASLLLFLHRSGGFAPLQSINFSRTVIQSLLDRELVVRQPKIAGWRSAEEQGSRGAEERFVQVLSPLPLRTSAPLLATTQNSLGRLLVRVQNTKHGFLLTITQDSDKLPTN